MSILVSTEPMSEAISRLLSGYDGVPPVEKARMIKRVERVTNNAIAERDAEIARLRGGLEKAVAAKGELLAFVRLAIEHLSDLSCGCDVCLGVLHEGNALVAKHGGGA